MRRANHARHPVTANINRSHQVEPQQRKIGQVILRQTLARQMSVQAAQTTKPVYAHADAFQVRKYDASSVADHHVLDITVTINQHSDLTMNLVRGFG